MSRKSPSDHLPTTNEVRERFIDGFPMDTWAVARDECARDFDRWLAAHDRQVAARTRREVLNTLPLPDEDARSGMFHARGLIAAHIIEKEGAGR